MNPSGLHVNKPVVAAIGIGVVVIIYLWFKYTSPTAVTELSMDTFDKAKAAVAKITVHHNTSLIFKVEGKDVKIAYREVTPANPKLDILFLHGMKFKSQNWVSEPVFTLQMMYIFNYRAVAIDLPALIRQLALLGDSRLYIGLEKDIYKSFPNLINPFPHKKILDWSKLKEAADGYGDSPSAEVNKGEFIKEAIQALKLNKPVIVSPSMSGSFALPFLFSEPESALSRCRGYVPVAPVYTEKFVEQYKKTKVPTLIIYGSKDSGLGFTSRDNLKNIPGSKVIELPDAGHACYLDRPDEFHEHLHTFLVTLED